MNKCKIFWASVFGVIGTVVIGILVWTGLYFIFPNIKDGTDKIFKWNDYAVQEEIGEEDEPTTILPNNNAQIAFGNDFIDITIG